MLIYIYYISRHGYYIYIMNTLILLIKTAYNLEVLEGIVNTRIYSLRICITNT